MEKEYELGEEEKKVQEKIYFSLKFSGIQVH